MVMPGVAALEVHVPRVMEQSPETAATAATIERGTHCYHTSHATTSVRAKAVLMRGMSTPHGVTAPAS
jgi:hypothetical protein